jgi:hypothetical protein
VAVAEDGPSSAPGLSAALPFRPGTPGQATAASSTHAAPTSSTALGRWPMRGAAARPGRGRSRGGRHHRRTGRAALAHPTGVNGCDTRTGFLFRSYRHPELRKVEQGRTWHLRPPLWHPVRARTRLCPLPDAPRGLLHGGLSAQRLRLEGDGRNTAERGRGVDRSFVNCATLMTAKTSSRAWRWLGCWSVAWWQWLIDGGDAGGVHPVRLADGRSGRR